MNKVRRLIAGRHRNSGRMDILAIALISLALVVALIFVLLRIIGHSEEHVDKVRKTKVIYKEALRWRPDSKLSESRIREDFANASGRTEADYGDLHLNEKSVKLIGKMYRLEVLKLTRATIEDKWLDHLTNLPLTELALHGTPITDKAIPYILKMQKLEFLGIGDTEITDKGLEELSSSKSIKHLEINLGRCITNDGIKYLGRMSQLEQLELESSKALTGQCITYLTNLKRLYYLDLGNMKFAPGDLAPLSSFKTLTMLDLSNCNLNDKNIANIAKVKTLVFLNVSGSDFTDKGLKQLLKLKNLEHLNIKDCPNVTRLAVKEFKTAFPGIKMKYSRKTSLSEKLSREDVKMELNFLKLEAEKELEKSH